MTARSASGVRCSQWHQRRATSASLRAAAAALAELERRLGYSASYREKAIAEREKDIAEGKYAEQANSTRQEVAKAEAKLLRLKSGPLPEFDRPYIRSWHQRRDLVRRPEPGQKLVDIIEVKVP
jgi:multidrug efflux pump subunit AcrA (membrane-fusion protein)